MSEEKLPVGTRIKFLQTLEQGPTEETPAFLFANKGDGGEIVSQQGFGPWDYSVKWDLWPTSFHAKYGTEFVEDK